MNGDSAVDTYGFTRKFFVAAWKFIGNDVYKVVLSLFAGAELPKRVTSTSILLPSMIQFP